LINSQYAETVVKHPDDFVIGIGHTRWPTMGAATTVNAQPIWSNDKQWAVVLNGIIENNVELTARLKKMNYIFETENDVECVANLLQDMSLKYPNDTMATFVSVLSQIEGAYGVCVLHASEQRVYCASLKNFLKFLSFFFLFKGLSSPVCLGIGKDELFIASDAVAFNTYTENVIHLDDYEILVIDKTGHKVKSRKVFF
jgi:glucosamine--fructose-6-phosphate aminotransferase (isomerizing)